MAFNADLRREARKAFLALSAGDTAGKSASSELVDNDVEDVTDPSADDGTVFSRSTPVSLLPCLCCESNTEMFSASNWTSNLLIY